MTDHQVPATTLVVSVDHGNWANTMRGYCRGCFDRIPSFLVKWFEPHGPDWARTVKIADWDYCDGCDCPTGVGTLRHEGRA